MDVDVGVGVGVGVGGGGVENDGGFGFVPTRMAEELPRIIANPESDSSCGATGLLGGEDLNGVEVDVGVGSAERVGVAERRTRSVRATLLAHVR